MHERRSPPLSACDGLAVHFDVDLVDFLDAPLAENTDRGIAPSLAACGEMLSELLIDTRVLAVTVTEFNPHHGSKDGSTTQRLLEILVGCLGSPGSGLADPTRKSRNGSHPRRPPDRRLFQPDDQPETWIGGPTRTLALGSKSPAMRAESRSQGLLSQSAPLIEHQRQRLTAAFSNTDAGSRLTRSAQLRWTATAATPSGFSSLTLGMRPLVLDQSSGHNRVSLPRGKGQRSVSASAGWPPQAQLGSPKTATAAIANAMPPKKATQAHFLARQASRPAINACDR